ncbi:hypothetical protein EVAR_67659_1 [Eumeta japonica]|uniref:Uncharacterized protein n=1 Tax=Eumeta variegata TaxID=151549 RepID=A0A4C1Z8N6_EUMVA|nr:hypothetical protein EVAR_67659_1 [Eumeta japonica]
MSTHGRITCGPRPPAPRDGAAALLDLLRGGGAAPRTPPSPRRRLFLIRVRHAPGAPPAVVTRRHTDCLSIYVTKCFLSYSM